MKKFKFLTVILSVMVFMGSFAACNPATSSTSSSSSSSQEPTSVHTCESVCEICEKCTDAEWTEDACADKCQGHTQTPAHTCESVCPTCNKCTDAECTEDACADKCQGHTQAPAHTCESVCPVCQKCKDAECTETVCAEKCEGCVVVDPNWDTYELNFLSFNIASTLETETASPTAWVNRREGLVDFINNSGAQVISLQEVTDWREKPAETPEGGEGTEGGAATVAEEGTEGTEGTEGGASSETAKPLEEVNQRVYLEQNLANNYEMIYFGGQLNLATIYDKKVFNLVSQETYWFSDTPDKESSGWDGANYRGVGILILEHRATGEKVKAINMTAPAEKITGNIKAFDLLTERTLSKDVNMVTLLCGDFNVEPEQYGYLIAADKLQDCRVTAAESTSRNKSTWNGYTDFDEMIIDYCFVTANDGVKVLTYQVRDDKVSGKYLSDHYAVQATVRIYRNSDDAWSDFA